MPVDFVAPVRFLHTAYDADDWVAIFLKAYATSRVTQRIGPISRMASATFQAWLRAENAAGVNVYVSVNAVEPHQRSRRRSAIRAIRHVFLDADADASSVLRAIADRADLPSPSYVLHSSPDRAHVCWRVTGFTSERVEAVQKQLARELGTDPAATPCTQTTRVPGFFYLKSQVRDAAPRDDRVSTHGSPAHARGLPDCQHDADVHIATRVRNDRGRG